MSSGETTEATFGESRLSDLLGAELEGETAGRDGKPAAECPYIFARAEVDQQTYDKDWLPLRIAWYTGWKRTSPVPKKFEHRRKLTGT